MRKDWFDPHPVHCRKKQKSHCEEKKEMALYYAMFGGEISQIHKPLDRRRSVSRGTRRQKLFIFIIFLSAFSHPSLLCECCSKRRREKRFILSLMCLIAVGRGLLFSEFISRGIRHGVSLAAFDTCQVRRGENRQAVCQKIDIDFEFMKTNPFVSLCLKPFLKLEESVKKQCLQFRPFIRIRKPHFHFSCEIRTFALDCQNCKNVFVSFFKRCVA